MAVKVCLMADLHGFLPDFDQDTKLLILAGDIEPSEGASTEWIARMLDWRGDRASMIIPGNHDRYKGSLKEFSGNFRGITIWASPVTVGESKGRRHVMSNAEAAKYYNTMPLGVDIAVVHSPPYGILDCCDGEHIGSRSLLDAAIFSGPRYLVCGHVHNNYGVAQLANNRPTTVCNVALCGFPEKKIVNLPMYLYL